MKSLYLTVIIWITILLSGCIDPYNPPAITAPDQYLVVEGNINSSGPTTIRLSLTRNLIDTSNYPLNDAKVYVEGKAGGSFELMNKNNGEYQIEQLNLNAAEQYRLHIRISDGREYASEFVNVLESPEIDSITWERRNEGVQVQVTTHNANNKAKYYQWAFDETWEFHSAFYSSMKYENDTFKIRFVSEQIYTCFKSGKSSIISVGSSEQLVDNVIYKYPLIIISPSASDRLSVKYSILVKQTALSQEGYQYWQNIKKITENLGSIFDPQPSSIKGNIQNINDPSEPVFGFVTISNQTQKRLFITRAQYGFANRVFTGYEGCETDSIPGTGLYPREFLPGDVPLYETKDASGKDQLVVGSVGCTDCTLRGTTVKPDFWQ